jgi:aspartate racemase
MVVHYCRHPPVLVAEDGRALPPLRPDPRLLEAARRVGAVADFLVVISNGAHVLAADIERAAGRPIVSMVDATVTEVLRRGWRRAGVLGLGEPFVYTRPLMEMGIGCATVDGDARNALDAAIFRVMEDGDGPAEAAAAGRAVDLLRARGVDGVIPGCTEIPLLLGEAADAQDLVNPVQLLAEAAVREAVESKT